MSMPWSRILRPASKADSAARRRAARRSRPSPEAMEGRQLLSTMTFNVTNNADNGSNTAPLVNSLRWAILKADAVGAGNTAEIDFHLPTTLPTATSPVAPLPAVTVPTVFNGTTQAGYAGTPLVRLDGSQAGAGAVGLRFAGAVASGSQVNGLQVVGWDGGGILADGASQVHLDHDWVGIANVNFGEGNRTITLGNGTFGVEFANGANGGWVTNSVVSANRYNGVVVTNHSNTAYIGYSKIGTDPTGKNATTPSGVSFGNGVTGGGGSGVVINRGSTNADLYMDVISDNHDYGVFVTDPGTDYAYIDANQIGTDITGTQAFPNHFGVTIANGAQHANVGYQGAGNLISGNAWDGVQVLTGSSSTTISYNKIGTNLAGTAVLANGGSGVAIAQGSHGNNVAGNLLSGNLGDGVYLSDPGTIANTIQGNLIGTDTTGKLALGNALSGVFLIGGPSNNIIGGTTAAARNVIAANGGDGVQIDYANTVGNTVAGNYIGTDATGEVALGNHRDGVYLWAGASGNTIGGTTASARNIISGNAESGVIIDGSAGNLVEGNFLGTDRTGAKPLGNHFGVQLVNGSRSNVVGGTTAGARNVISGNRWDGVQLLSGANNNQVQGNFIGTDATGKLVLGNAASGVAIASGANSNTIGGPSAAYRNVISGNWGDGVYVSDSGTNANTIQFDYIGTDVTGELPVSNQMHGVIVQNSADGTHVYNDLISANLADGVLVTNSATNTTLSGDWIGLDGTGTRALRAAGRNYSNNFGVQISNGASATSVGNSVISGNLVGVEVDFGATNNWIVYNHIGTDVAGTGNVGNLQDGIILNQTAGNLVGYNTLVYNGDVGILFLNAEQNSDVGNAFSVVVNGVTQTNRLGAEDHDF